MDRPTLVALENKVALGLQEAASRIEAQEYAKEPDLDFLTTKDWEKLFNTLEVSAKILSGDY